MEKLKATILEFVQKLDKRLTDSYPVRYKRQFNIVLTDIPGMLNTLPNLEFGYTTPFDGKEVTYNLLFESSRDFISVYVNDKRSGFITYSTAVLHPEREYDRLEHDLFHAIRKIESLITARIVT
jgi:hypothetical protein